MKSDDSPTADRECFHTRLIAASREELLDAFVRPDRLPRWWGPNGFTSTFETFEPRPGGTWRFVLHGPDGQDYPNLNRIVELGLERIVVEHIDEHHHFMLTISLDAQESGGTLVGWRQVFDTAVHRDQVAPFVLVANEQNLDRLAAEVG